MMKSKKGSDLSMNVIIIAAIALLVLVILAVLLFRTGGQITKGTGCEGIGGSCKYSENPSTPGETWIHNLALDTTCQATNDDKECWVKLK